jgi:hypothetical protein
LCTHSLSLPTFNRTRRFITCSHKNPRIFPFLNQTNAVQSTLIWLAHDYWEDLPVRRRCVSLPRGRPLGRWGTLPSFLPSAAEIPRDSSNRPPTKVTHKADTHRVQPTPSSVRETGTRTELGEPILIEPTHIKWRRI